MSYWIRHLSRNAFVILVNYYLKFMLHVNNAHVFWGGQWPAQNSLAWVYENICLMGGLNIIENNLFNFSEKNIIKIYLVYSRHIWLRLEQEWNCSGTVP